MSSLNVARPVGLRPTLRCDPSNAGGLSDELEQEVRQVLDWAGLVLDDWQEAFLFESLRMAGDLWAAFEVAGVVPRQNGKGAILEARQLAGLYVLGEPLQIHTAHEFKTCSEHFLRVKGLIEGSDDLFSQVKIIRTGAGEQAIELKTGERLRFVARSRNAIRGFSIDAIYFDEAFELPVATMGNILPALSARPNPQVWYLSSAPHYTSEFLHAVLKRAESPDPGRLMLRAWESEPGTRPDDVAAWARANPALGIRIDEEFVRNEMRTLCATPEGVAEFSRERLGIREGGETEGGAIPMARWDQLRMDPTPKIPNPVYALDSDGTHSSVSVAGRLPNGHLFVECIQWRAGTNWVKGYVAGQLRGGSKPPIRVDGTGSTGALVQELRDAGVEVIEVTPQEYRQACGALLTAVVDGTIGHPGQAELDVAARAAGKREIGKEGGWVWVRPGSVDISALKAATLALSGVEKKRAPRVHVWEGGDPNLPDLNCSDCGHHASAHKATYRGRGGCHRCSCDRWVSMKAVASPELSRQI